MNVTFTSVPAGWLTVTPSSGHTPLALSVSVNPTSLSPGSYGGSIIISAGSYQTVVAVTMAVTNPPSSIIVTSSNFNPPASGSTGSTITFNYTTGGTMPTAEVDVSSTGDIIPFTVAVANVSSKGGGTVPVWLRVNPLGALPSTSTSGVAVSGSNVRIFLTLDSPTLQTFDVVSYQATITIAATNSANGSYTVGVTLNVSAGSPKLYSIFPISMPAISGTTTYTGPNPVITVYGDNYFASSSSVEISQNGGIPIPLKTTWLSRQVLQATIPYGYLTPSQSAPPYPVSWQILVSNGAPANNPSASQATVSSPVPFSVTDPSMPYIQSVVNSASFSSTAVQTGTAPDPVPLGGTSVSPREIVSIFGQNLGPSSVVTGNPTGYPVTYAPVIPPYETVYVTFQPNPAAATPPPPLLAPLIMISSNQINAIVPYELTAYPPGTPIAITVFNNFNTNTFPVVMEEPANPGIFTFGGNGQGQSAVLNFDSASGTVTVNSAKNAAPRASAIEIYATGLGDIVPGVTITATDSSPTPQSASVVLPLTIRPSLVITPGTLPNGVTNQPYTATLSAIGGAPPYSWSTSTALPTGLTQTAGVLSGTPTVAGTFLVTFLLSDGSTPALTASMTYSFTIASSLAITNTALPAGVVGLTYPTTALVAVGGTGVTLPYTWSSIGLAATGLALDPATGSLSGMPTTAGTFPVSFKVTDSSSTAQTATMTYTLTVGPPIVIAPATLPAAVVNQNYVPVTLVAAGASCPCMWSSTGVPAGMTFDSSSQLLSGVPTGPAGTAMIAITVTDSSIPALTATTTYTLSINSTIAVTITSLPTGTVGALYAPLTLTVTGGIPPIKWTSSGLPAGMSVQPDKVYPNVWELGGTPQYPLILPLPDGTVAPTVPVYLADNSYRVEINGQSAVVFYAGTSGYAVGGLVQLNAIVPPNAPTGASIPITLSIGPVVNGVATARRSQPGATIAVK